MGYEIVGAVFDEAGNPISAEELEAEILARYGVESGAMVPASMLRTLQLPRANNAATSPANIPNLGAFIRRAGTLARQASPAARLQAPAVVPTAPGPVDEVPLPVSSTGTVAAGSQQVIPVTSQIIFRPQRLIVPDSIAPFFTVDSIMVGNVPLFAGSGSLPAEVFTPESVGANIRKVTATPGLQIVVTVTNIDTVAHPFRAALFGPGSQPEGCR